MEMLLVNPRKRRRKAAKSGGAKRRRRKVGAKRRRRSSGKRRAATGYTIGNAPVRRRKLNPRKRRRSRSRRRSFRRRNPISLRSFRPTNIMDTMMGAVPGAVGALGLDVALGFLPIPVTWKAGIPGYLTKIVGAIGVGMVAQNFVGSATAGKITTGALTVMFHGILRQLVSSNLPGVPLGLYLDTPGLGYAGSGYNPVGGMYLPDISSDRMGMDMDTGSQMGMYMDAGASDYY